MTTLQQELDQLTANIGRLAADHGMKLVKKYVGAVRVGDYLIYDVTGYEQDPSREEGVMQEVEHTQCRRVVATGGEQGSGPRPGQNWIALEGDERIRKYGDRRGDEVLVFEPKKEEAKGLPPGLLAAVEGTG